MRKMDGIIICLLAALVLAGMVEAVSSLSNSGGGYGDAEKKWRRTERMLAGRDSKGNGDALNDILDVLKELLD